MQLPQDSDLIGVGQELSLTVASRQGHVKVVRLLLEAGADKNSVGNIGFTALMAASRQGHIEVVQVLLNAGAD